MLCVARFNLFTGHLVRLNKGFFPCSLTACTEKYQLIEFWLECCGDNNYDDNDINGNSVIIIIVIIPYQGRHKPFFFSFCQYCFAQLRDKETHFCFESKKTNQNIMLNLKGNGKYTSFPNFFPPFTLQRQIQYFCAQIHRKWNVWFQFV